MRTSRRGGCWLLLVLLLSILGCGGSTYVKKGPETKSNTVKISNCNATPDWVQVAKNDTLTWNIDPPDGHTYSINFPGSTPVSSPTVPPGTSQKVTGDLLCSTLGWIKGGLCEYQYNLIQDGTKTCPDPGVHVIPGPPG
jgi:hypothetical protein